MLLYRIKCWSVLGFMIFAVFCESIGELFNDVGYLILASPVALFFVVTNPSYLSQMKKSAQKFFVDLFWDIMAWTLIVFLIAFAFIALAFSIVGCLVVAAGIGVLFCYFKARDYFRSLAKKTRKQRWFSLQNFMVDILDTEDPKRPVKGAIVFLVEPDMMDNSRNVIIFHGANIDTKELKECRSRLDSEINHRYARAAFLSEN